MWHWGKVNPIAEQSFDARARSIPQLFTRFAGGLCDKPLHRPPARALKFRQSASCRELLLLTGTRPITAGPSSPIHVLQKTANIGNKASDVRPSRASSTLPHSPLRGGQRRAYSRRPSRVAMRTCAGQAGADLQQIRDKLRQQAAFETAELELLLLSCLRPGWAHAASPQVEADVGARLLRFAACVDCRRLLRTRIATCYPRSSSRGPLIRTSMSTHVLKDADLFGCSHFRGELKIIIIDFFSLRHRAHPCDLTRCASCQNCLLAPVSPQVHRGARGRAARARA